MTYYTMSNGFIKSDLVIFDEVVSNESLSIMHCHAVSKPIRCRSTPLFWPSEARC